MLGAKALSAVKKAVWGVDLFEEALPLDQSVLRELQDLHSSGRLDVVPAYVFSPMTKIEYLAEKTLEDMLRARLEDSQVKFGRPRIIVQDTLSVMSAVQSLLEFAEEEDAGLIILSSHGRKGLARLMLGSFAERVLHSAKVPVFILNQHARTHPTRLPARAPKRETTDPATTCASSTVRENP